jgi:hypothetical protein
MDVRLARRVSCCIPLATWPMAAFIARSRVENWLPGTALAVANCTLALLSDLASTADQSTAGFSAAWTRHPVQWHCRLHHLCQSVPCQSLCCDMTSTGLHVCCSDQADCTLHAMDARECTNVETRKNVQVSQQTDSWSTHLAEMATAPAHNTVPFSHEGW